MRRRAFIKTAAAILSGLAVPRHAMSAQPQTYRLGLVSLAAFTAGSSPGQIADQLGEQLKQDGFVPGTNLDILKREAYGEREKLPALIADLIRSKVDAIVALGYPVALAAKQATSDIPIVIFNTGDPVRLHLVDSLSRPGGNITGLSDVAAELAPKRLDLLKQAVPQLRRVAMLWNAGDLGMTSRYDASAAAAKALDITVQALGVQEPDDFTLAFAAMEQSMPDGLLMVADALTSLNRTRVFEFAAKHRLPAIYETETFVHDGGLMSYGPDLTEMTQRGADLVGRILRGSKPSALPLEQPTRFRLAFNLKTAKAAGLTISPHLLAAADEVVE